MSEKRGARRAEKLATAADNFAARRCLISVREHWMAILGRPGSAEISPHRLRDSSQEPASPCGNSPPQ
jgi:hypothetical protein